MKSPISLTFTLQKTCFVGLWQAASFSLQYYYIFSKMTAFNKKVFVPEYYFEQDQNQFIITSQNFYSDKFHMFWEGHTKTCQTTGRFYRKKCPALQIECFSFFHFHFFLKFHFRPSIPKHWLHISKKCMRVKKDRIVVRTPNLMLFAMPVEKHSKNGITKCTTKVLAHLMWYTNATFADK